MIVELFSKVLNYRLAYHRLARPANPITLTFSVTNRCQSRCQTCFIWKLYRERPDLEEDELSLEEIERIFEGLGHVYFFNVSGGEPFLRQDLPQIVVLALRYLTPRIVHIPTNALSPGLVEKGTFAILSQMHKMGYGDIPLTIKPSLDGVGEQHDRIRGVPGNFEKVIRVVESLKGIREQYANLHVELGTVISTANLDSIAQIADFVQTLEVESYRHEIAETRAEFFNLDEPITPSAAAYLEAVAEFGRRTRAGIHRQRRLTRMTEALRLVYYDYAVRVLQENRQVLPCFGGISNVHINPYGQVWPCCTLAYAHPLGELRQADYDFKRVWHSRQAQAVRKYIHDRKCACPLANQMYSNILCSPSAVSRVLFTLVQMRRVKR
jgi:MoaA/NifB/PqqE/SkfB family radical SAM enzyme